MSDDSILKSTSFSVLNTDEQYAIRNIFTDKGKKPDITAISCNRYPLATSLTIHSQRVATTNPAIFRFLSAEQKKSLNQDLFFSLYMLATQYALDEAEHRRQQLTKLGQQISHCAFLINSLNQSSTKVTPESLLVEKIDASEKNLKYLGLTQVAPLIAEKITLPSKDSVR
jgi:hypothetical protein